MAFSRSSSGKESAESSKVDTLSQPGSEPSSSNNTICSAHSPAQQALEEVQHAGEPKSAKRRSSRARLFSNGFTRLLRSSSDAKGNELATHTENSGDDGRDTTELPRTGAVDDTRIVSMTKQVARGLPSPLGNRHDTDAIEGSEAPSMPTTLKTMVTILSEIKVLKADQNQEFWAIVEIEGVLHNRRELADSNIDVVFIVDNGYYVSKDGLMRALEAATGGLHQLDRGDRVALYTTHCTHGSVASTVPDRLLPLRSVCSDTEEVFRNLTLDIAKYGTQEWNPPRPTPPMSNVILAIAKSLEMGSPKHQRCHMILLSPVFNVLHSVSDTFPNLHVHQINSAVLPFVPNEEHREMVCHETCCKNVTASNWTHYQSVPGRIKQIILQARSTGPVGSITDIHVDLRPKSGCEVLEIDGSTTLNALRPGQSFCFLVRLRVSSAKTHELCESSLDPLLEHSLEATTIRQELYLADKLNAKLAHLLSVQVFHKNTLNAPGTWCYTEVPLVAITRLGRLAPPRDFSVEVQRRRIFYRLNKLDNEATKREMKKLAIAVSDESEDLKQIVQRMAKEIHWHHAVLEYEASSRQKLPLCSGPIGKAMVHHMYQHETDSLITEMASAEHHEHIQAMLDAKMNKRKGMAIM
ncbi:uncharacterized protein N0V89_000231 [Didymosphaeria variabile]|uniref:Uncharacterized protein n=1 Tax=Didymosphaeria variabile TaxID=1932322 RepID=A0A9W9CFN9_9PLEO|nr:uncharacterized protein N0V89_000231 [Didymosphaeria variabile]KAJ4359675.1 hypothetical protein N0V89_000231 [Didymosphaeria variabile]